MNASPILRAIMLDPTLFSRAILGRPLRPYQAEAARAIAASVLNREGKSISVMISRQGGKNELSAHLEAYLLNLYQQAGGNIIKCAPTFKPQVINSKQRLETMLNNPLNRGRWHSEWSYVTRLGEARALFFSANESSNVVGATAHIALEFDEAQDIAPRKHDRDFMPMASSTNCTRVYYGTAWDDQGLLETMKQTHRDIERQRSDKRHFEYPWWVVAEQNPAYARFVEAERDRLGEDHPLFRTQYKLETLSGQSRFLGPQQRALLRGDHPRLHSPGSDETIVAGVDVAGGDATSLDAALRSAKPRKDSTVVTICAVGQEMLSDLIPEPTLRVLDHLYWTGLDQREQYERLLATLRDLWHCRSVAIDATGIGAGLADFLERSLGASAVRKVTFSAPTKSRLAFALLAAINGGRLKMYAWDGSEECVEVWRQIELCQQHIRSMGQIDFYVDEADGHDDFVISLALAVEAARDAMPTAAAALVPRRREYDDGRY